MNNPENPTEPEPEMNGTRGPVQMRINQSFDESASTGRQSVSRPVSTTKAVLEEVRKHHLRKLIDQRIPLQKALQAVELQPEVLKARMDVIEARFGRI